MNCIASRLHTNSIRYIRRDNENTKTRVRGKRETKWNLSGLKCDSLEYNRYERIRPYPKVNTNRQHGAHRGTI